MEPQEKLLKQDINISTAGDNVVITVGQNEMPAQWDNPATRIVIDHINLVPSNAVTVQLKDGATTDANLATFPQTNYGGAYALQQSQGFILGKRRDAYKRFYNRARRIQAVHCAV